jgi:hypothetical protein
LGGIAQFVIMIFAIIACVLEIGGPCWTWVSQSLPKWEEEPSPPGQIIDLAPRLSPLPPGKRIEPVVPPKPGGDTKPRPKSCESEFPDFARCEELGKDYHYDTVEDALQDLKRISGISSLSPEGNPSLATSGPCAEDNFFGYEPGKHIGVYDGSKYKATIGECPCCNDRGGRPRIEKRCSIVHVYN